MPMIDFDDHKFTVVSLSFAIPTGVILILWLFINHYVFRWRPFKLARVIVAHSLHSTPTSCSTNAALAFYWIFFVLPFAGFIGWGITVGLMFKPYFLGVIIAVGPTIILFIVYIFFDYHFRGYMMTVLSKLAFSFAFLVIVALTFGSVYMLQPQQWMATAYLFAFLPLLFFMLAYAFTHLRIPDREIKNALQDQEKLDAFIGRISDHDKKCFVGSFRLNVGWSIGVVLFSIACNFLFALDYWLKDRHNYKDERDPTLYTAIGFFLIDFVLLLAQIGSVINASYFYYIFMGFLVKICCITFSIKYWITGHGIVYFVMASFLLIRFILGVWQPSRDIQFDNPNHDKLITGLNQIVTKNHKKPIPVIVMSMIAWVILSAAFIVEAIFQYNHNFPALPFNMTQINAMIGSAAMSIPFSFCICAFLYLYYNDGKMTAGSYILYFLAVVGLCLFDALWQGAKHILLLRLLFPSVFIFFFSCIMLLLIIYFNPKMKCSPCSKAIAPLLIFLILTLGSLVLSVILPFACQHYYEEDYSKMEKLVGVMVVLIVCFLLLYAFFVFSLFQYKKFCNVQTIVTLIFAIAFLVAFSCCFDSVLRGAIIFCSIFIIFCLVFSFLYTWHNDWNFTLAPYLVTAIPSLIVLVLAVVAMFKLHNNKDIFYMSIIAFAFAFIFFGSSLFFWLQRQNFFWSWLSIVSLVCLIIAIVLVIVFIALKINDAFVVVSIIMLVILIAALLGLLCFLISQSVTNVIVFSNIFFPVRRLVNSKILTMGIFNFLYGLTFCSPWFWGLFASIFLDKHSEYGALASTCAIFLISWITCYFIIKFDYNTFASFGFIQKKEIEYAINTAMSASNVNINSAKLEKPNKADYDSYMKYVDQSVQSKRDISIFLSCVKAELFISSDVAFRSARDQVHGYFHSIGFKDEEIEFLTIPTGWDTAEKLQIYNLLEAIRTADPSKVDDENKYTNHVKKQEENRAKINLVKNVDPKKYKELLNKAEKSHSLFADGEFNAQTDHEPLVARNPWRRMEELYKNPMFDQGQGFNPNILKQGQLGDCYFISAMVAVSRKPNLVQAMFQEPVNNNAGIRCVNFHIMGKIVPVIVDTTLPFTGTYDTSTPKFCKPVTHNDQWWGTIVEKAYAKQYGSYEAIDGGNAHVALYRMIGGFPIAFYMSQMKTKEMVQNGTLWNLMLKWHNEGSFICAGSNPGRDTQQTNQGIILGHAYTVLQVVEVQGNKLIQLRNPWGNTEWKGDWSDNSSKWTTKLRNAVHYNDPNDDGIFWMCFKDFTSNYFSIYACIQPQTRFHYELNGTWKPGDKDGAKPYSKSNDATNLPQWLIRSKKSREKGNPKLQCFLEKSGGQSVCWIVMAYNKGAPVSLLYEGTKHHIEAVAASSTICSYEWDYDEPDEPVTIFFYRNKSPEETMWHFEIFADRPMEITFLGGPK